MKKIFQIVVSFLLTTNSCLLFSQEADVDQGSMDRKPLQGFHFGLLLGSYFANKGTAVVYDGYGYNADGNRNKFDTSFMYRRIIFDYGGGNNQVDQIAQALGVSHGEWIFDETDMPLVMKYVPAFCVGLNTNYFFDPRNAIILNANVSKLTITGNFGILLTTSPIGSQQPGYQNIKTCSIMGVEKRSIVQFGWQHLFGETEGVNFFLEGGPLLTMSKLVQNIAVVNKLQIDLRSFYLQPYSTSYRPIALQGYALGFFGGCGVNFRMKSKSLLQFLYDFSFEKTNLVIHTPLKLQHGLGLRVFYRI